jgi:hypothetical protein
MEENRYPEYIMEKLRKRQGLEAEDTSMDDVINQMMPDKAFDEVCNWEGLLGFGDVIRGWITDVYGIDFDELPNLYDQIETYKRALRAVGVHFE